MREQLEKKSNLIGCPFVFTNDRLFRISNTDRPEFFLEPVRNNFALAIKLTDVYLKFCLNNRFLDENIIGAVHIYNWPNRFQIFENIGIKTRFYFNSPANFLNIPVSFNWFITQVQHHALIALPIPFKFRQPIRILIFGYNSIYCNVFTVVRTVVNHYYKFRFAFDKIILTSYKYPINGLRFLGNNVLAKRWAYGRKYMDFLLFFSPNLLEMLWKIAVPLTIWAYMC